MNYSFAVKAEGNILTVINQTPEVPDGTYKINGHEETDMFNIAVTRRDPDGFAIMQATAYGKHLGPAGGPDA